MLNEYKESRRQSRFEVRGPGAAPPRGGLGGLGWTCPPHFFRINFPISLNLMKKGWGSGLVFDERKLCLWERKHFPVTFPFFVMDCKELLSQ